MTRKSRAARESHIPVNFQSTSRETHLLCLYPLALCSSSGSGDGNSGGTSIGPPRSGDQMSSLQRYRSQTMKDYGLMIEYKHLRQHVPAGIYVLPSFDESRVWYGTIFVHTGLYRNGIFKFTIKLPERYARKQKQDLLRGSE